MFLIWQVAFRNLIRAGLRTWLNASVLALVFIIIVFYNGLLTGWEERGKRNSIAWEFGYGHLAHALYDKYDPFSIQEGHGTLPESFLPKLAKEKGLTPVLVWQASIFPNQTQIPVILKGLPRDQKILNIPTAKFSRQGEGGGIPSVMGELMAEAAGLEVGDEVLLQWRDRNRTFNALPLKVVGVFDSDVPTVDQGIIYLAIEDLWEMTLFPGHASYWIVGGADQDTFLKEADSLPDWRFVSQEELLEPFKKLLDAEKGGAIVTNGILLIIALLAIFDTQVMTVFRRQREIGTYVSLGMTRFQVMGLFTLEGGMYSLLGMVLGGIIGTPLFYYLSQVGIPMDQINTDDYGVPIGDSIVPIFYFDSIIMITLTVFLAATSVSFLPAKKIAKMKPADALKGKAI